MAKAKKNPKKGQKVRMYKITPKSGVNADFEFMLIAASKKRVALAIASGKTRVMINHMEARKHRHTESGVLQIQPKKIEDQIHA